MLNVNSKLFNRGETIAVAVSGGCDSMSLLHYIHSNANLFDVNVIAINVEHGIRGQNSISDTKFVVDYCAKENIKLLCYSVDCVKKAKDDKLSIEQAARILRYQCFENALSSGECDKIATAHHQDDNVETVLFNIFRGTGLKGLIGINQAREDKIIRPFLTVDRVEIEEYAKANGVPFVTDETNASDDYTRNAIRHNVIPQIKRLFPEVNKSVVRLSDTVACDLEYLEQQAQKSVTIQNGVCKIDIPCHPAILGRAVILALKSLGISKDWEKKHIDDVKELLNQENGAMLNLLGGVIAVKEYDKIVLYREQAKDKAELSFSLGEFQLANKRFCVNEVKLDQDLDLRSGLYADIDKIPASAVFRTRREGDQFTKFGGGSKSLGDYLTDKKVALRERDQLVLLADGNEVLCIFGIAVSEKLKIDKYSKRAVGFLLTNA